MKGILCSFTLFAMLIGGLGDEVKYPFRHCDAIIEDRCESTFMTGDFPTAAELLELCPDALKFKSCFFDSIEECTSQRVNELTSSNNRSVAVFSFLFLNIEGILVDICDEDSALHASYAKSVECFRENLQEAGLCTMGAAGAYDNYKRLTIKDSNVSDEDEKRCLKSAFTIACMTSHAEHKCGDDGKSFVMEILRRLQLMTGQCSGLVGNVLKNQFLDSLDINPALKNTYAEVFDVMAR